MIAAALPFRTNAIAMSLLAVALALPGPDAGAQDIRGYLDKAAIPNSLKLLPPPPAAGSPAMALDEAVSQQALAMQGSARFTQAAHDAHHLPNSAEQFACAAGIPIDAENTPALYRLLERAQVDIAEANAVAKAKYHRSRPFVVNRQPTCTPADEAGLRQNGSYPSGHSALGWGWALILSEIDAAHADSILARGRSYGESRLVCNVHWQSDVVEGRHMAAATVARLHDNAAFRSDLEAARDEITDAHARRLKPGDNCTAQAQTLKMRPASAL